MTRFFFRLQNDVVRHLYRCNQHQRCGKLWANGTTRPFHLASCMNGKVVPFVLSDIGEGIKEVELMEWFVKTDDTVAQFDDICEVQSDKAAVVITSRYDGVIKKLYYKVGDVAQVGDPLVDIELEGEETESAKEETKTEPKAEEPKAEEPKAEEPKTEEPKKAEVSKPPAEVPASPVKADAPVVSSSKVLATPAVRSLAKVNNIDLSSVKGSGESGRVMKEDVEKLLQKKEPITTTAPIVPPTVIAEDKIERVKGIRKAMWTSMTASLQIPHFGYDDEFDMTNMVRLRSHVKDDTKRLIGSKISYMPFILKACSMALSQYPILNAHIDVENESIVYKADHNIGVAVDTKHGLLLPCVKGVQNMSVLEIATELNRLQHAGSKNKLSPQDLTDGTFALSNIGSIGGTYARPVIFPPQVAIGALGKIQRLPRYGYKQEIVESHIMAVSWSADHRVIEGATMARFSNVMKSFLENPDSMLLHLK